MSVLVFVGPNATNEIPDLVKRYDQSYLFEPLPGVCQQLREMVGKKANIIQAACGEKDGQAAFNIYNRNGLSSSLGIITGQAVKRFERFDLTIQGSISVDVINLYEWLKRKSITVIDRLIIDAQGMDLAILKTLEPMLKTGSIKRVTAEADGVGFRHYDGVPDNGIESHLTFMRACGFARLPNGGAAIHPNLEWEHESQSTFNQRIQRMACRI